MDVPRFIHPYQSMDTWAASSATSVLTPVCFNYLQMLSKSPAVTHPDSCRDQCRKTQDWTEASKGTQAAHPARHQLGSEPAAAAPFSQSP